MESKEGHEFHGEPVLRKLMEAEKREMSVQDICTAILYVPEVNFDERAAQLLMEAIKARIEISNFKHTDMAVSAIESLEDAATCMYVATEDMLDEPELDGINTLEPATLDRFVERV